MKKVRYIMNEEDLKILKQTLKDVKKLDIFKDRKKQRNKTRKTKKIA